MNTGDPTIWDKPIDVPEWVIHQVDEDVYRYLGENAKVTSIYPHGASYWTRTAGITTEQADGSEKSFFIKVSQGDNGLRMMMSEEEGLKAINNAVTNFAPKAYGVGTYKADSNIHYILIEFREMTDDVPEPVPFAQKLKEMHTQGISPTGKFGFHREVYLGLFTQYAEWQDSWEVFFTKNMQEIMDREDTVQGLDEEFTELKKAVIEKVIPRLLRPLETGGNKIQPCLVHTDLWDGNCSTDVDSNTPVIYDPGCIYAHHEYEMAPWRPERHKMRRAYIRAYTRVNPVSAPAEDFEDRLLLYCMRFDMQSSSCYPGNLRFRKLCLEHARTLVGKFPNGYEGSEPPASAGAQE